MQAYDWRREWEHGTEWSYGPNYFVVQLNGCYGDRLATIDCVGKMT